MDFVFKMALIILTMSGEICVWVAECRLDDCKEAIIFGLQTLVE